MKADVRVLNLLKSAIDPQRPSSLNAFLTAQGEHIVIRARSTLSVLLVFSLIPLSAFPDESISGVWRVAKIEREYSASTNESPEPSQLMFTNSHYSIVWIPVEQGTHAFETRWQPTDQEKLQRYGEIVVNTGTYSVEGSRLRIVPIVARVPEFMGGYIDYEISWNGDNLVLTFMDEVTFDGVRAPWVAPRGGRQHLTLNRVDD